MAAGDGRGGQRDGTGERPDQPRLALEVAQGWNAQHWAVPRSWKDRKEASALPLPGTQQCQHLDFVQLSGTHLGLVTRGGVRQAVGIVLSH